MSAQIIYGVDFRKHLDGQKYKVAEGPIDFAALEAEIACALWFNDAGTVGLPYVAPDKDPA